MDPIVFNPSGAPKPAQSSTPPPEPNEPEQEAQIPLNTAPVQPTTEPLLGTLKPFSESFAPEPDSPEHVYNQAVNITRPGEPAPQLLPEPTPIPPSVVAYTPQAPISPQVPLSGPKPPNHKKLYALVGGVLVLIGLTVGTVFGYVIPNQPANVWDTGLNRTGKAVTQLVDSSTKKESLDAFKKSEVKASMTGSVGKTVYTGTLGSTFDSATSNGTFTVTAKTPGKADQTYSVKYLSDLLKGRTLPTINLQFNGIKALGVDDLLPGLTNYDGKWITIDEQFLTSVGVTKAAMSTQTNLTHEDFASLVKDISSTTTDRVFTTDTAKAVFERKANHGREKVDGIDAYRYTVGINKAHYKDYCNALVDKITANKAYKKLPYVDPKDISGDKESFKKTCASTADGLKDGDTFELWIDSRYKLVHKVRFADTKNTKTYTDIGQTYKGGDDVSMFIRTHDDASKSDINLTVATNLKTQNTTINASITGGEADSPYKFRFDLSAKPYSGTIDAKQPTNAVPINDVLKTLGIDPSLFAAALNSGSNTKNEPVVINAEDTERQTDIRGLHAELEGFYNEYGYYPTLASINDRAWRAANMVTVSQDSFKDPKGTTTLLADKTTATQYGYTATACTATGCKAYSLSATLSGGTIYTKKSLN